MFQSLGNQKTQRFVKAGLLVLKQTREDKLTSDCNVIQDVTRIKEVVQYLSSIQRKHTQILGKMILFYKEILFTCNSSVLTLKQGKNTRVKNKKMCKQPLTVLLLCS